MDDYFFIHRLLNLDKKDFDAYHVKFYDDETPIIVKAKSDTMAGILAIASMMHENKAGWGIEYIEHVKTGHKTPFEV